MDLMVWALGVFSLVRQRGSDKFPMGLGQTLMYRKAKWQQESVLLYFKEI